MFVVDVSTAAKKQVIPTYIPKAYPLLAHHDWDLNRRIWTQAL